VIFSCLRNSFSTVAPTFVVPVNKFLSAFVIVDAQDVAVDGASPTDASAVALAKSLIPTVPHPAIEYNLPVLDVQRY
jgi:hypothetical protein